MYAHFLKINMEAYITRIWMYTLFEPQFHWFYFRLISRAVGKELEKWGELGASS